MSVFSTSLAIAIPCDSEVDGSRRVSMSSEPSSSFGMNSVPRKGTEARAAASRAAALATTVSRCVRA